MALKLRRLSYPLGAEVCDIDVTASISESEFGAIYQAFLDPESRLTLVEAAEAVRGGDFYRTLRRLRTLLPREERLLAGPEGGSA